MTKPENTYAYTWRMFEKDVKSLCKRIDFSNYDCLCGIAAGGLPLLTKLSNVVGLPYIIVKSESYEDKVRQKGISIDAGSVVVRRKRVLIIDDIADSGRTIEAVAAELKWRGAESIESLTLFYKPQSVVVPEWYVHEVENPQWIVFPWE